MYEKEKKLKKRIVKRKEVDGKVKKEKKSCIYFKKDLSS